MTDRQFVSLILFAVLALTAARGLAGDVPAGAGYRISSSTLDGGTPQTSEHAPSGYRILGTIGQPDVAVSSSDSMRLEGGFWPASRVARPTPIFSNGFE